jgi:hypothetical protein
MASLRFQLLGGVVIGILVVVVALTVLLGRSARVATPRPAPQAAVAPEPTATPAAAPSPERISRSKGQSDWTFFFRAGDSLSRMSDGVALGVVVRLERAHGFPDGVGPAYVVRSPDQRETIFDADQLERGARVDAVREVARPPIAVPAR